jgi:malate synthase
MKKNCCFNCSSQSLHLQEKKILIDGQQASGSLMNFRIIYFPQSRRINKERNRSLFYLPKLEHYLEARWWNDVLSLHKGI